MNVQQEGLGNCTSCGSPIMRAIGQPGIKGVCLGCQAAAQPKTGKTVVVTGETGEGSALGRVQTQEVEHNPGEASALPKDPEAVRQAIIAKANAKGVAPAPTPTPVSIITPTTQPLEDGAVHISLTLEELEHDTQPLVDLMLQRVYDALDNLPPGKTLKETKRLIRIQDRISSNLKETK